MSDATPDVKSDIGPADFGVPAKYSEEARHYASWMVAQERERCAKVCEERVQECEDDFSCDGDERWRVYAKHARRLAAAIRLTPPADREIR